MSKQEILTQTLLQNMQQSLDEKDRLIDSLNATINKLTTTINNQEKEIKYLNEKVDYLVRSKFTSKSEKTDINQPSLFDDLKEDKIIVEEDKEEIKIEYNRKKRGKKTPPLNIPRIEIEHDISEEEKICKCGCQKVLLKKIVSSQYDVIPAEFRIIENIRKVYTCPNKCGAKIITAPLPPMPLPRHQVTSSFVSTIIVQKFEDHIPLTRQVKIYKNRFNIPFTTSTFSNWIINTSKLVLVPLIARLNEILLLSKYIQVDETTLQVLNEKNKSAKSKSFIWVRCSTDNQKIVLMDYSSSRAMNNANRLFEGFSGYLQTDGYAGYNDVANKPDVTQLGCWAHARRKFVDITKSSKSCDRSKEFANDAVILIRRLYKIEKDIKDRPIKDKQIIRNDKSRIVIDDIKKWLESNFNEALQLGGSISKAFTYLHNQFPKLIVYLEDGRLNIDNK
jgi:transposase